MPARTLPKDRLRRYAAELALVRDAFDLVQNHIVITDADAHILYANKAAEQVTGYSRTEMLGKNPGDLWGGKMPAAVWRAAWKTMKTNKHPVEMEVLNKRKDGQELWQSLHISPVLDAKGNVRFFIGIEPEVTAAKHAEEFHKQFLSVVGHKALGPATAIRWILELLLEEKTLAPQHRKKLEELYSEDVALVSLLRDLLFLTRMGKGHPDNQLIDVAKATHQAIGVLQKRIDTVTFRFRSPQHSCIVRSTVVLVESLLEEALAGMALLLPKKSVVRVSLQSGKGGCFISCRAVNPGASAGRKVRNEYLPSAFFVANLIARYIGWHIEFEARRFELTIRLHPMHRAHKVHW